jgi:hypothetical protein
MCVVPGPASQDAVFKRVYASPGLQCDGSAVFQFLKVRYSIAETFFRPHFRNRFVCPKYCGSADYISICLHLEVSVASRTFYSSVEGRKKQCRKALAPSTHYSGKYYRRQIVFTKQKEHCRPRCTFYVQMNYKCTMQTRALQARVRASSSR